MGFFIFLCFFLFLAVFFLSSLDQYLKSGVVLFGSVLYMYIIWPLRYVCVYTFCWLIVFV